MYTDCFECGAKGKLTINRRKAVCNCFHCGFRHWGKLLLKAGGSLGELDPSIDEIADGDWLSGATTEGRQHPRKYELPRDFMPLSQLRDMKTGDYWLTRASRYLLSRGVTVYQIRRHNIGICLEGAMAKRIVFPVYHALDGSLLGATGRTLAASPVKWRHSKGLRGCFVAQSDLHWQAIGAAMVVTEGVTDALAVARAESYRRPVVALLGTSLTDEKYEALQDSRVIILWLDPDRAGRSAVGTVGAELVDRGHKVYVMRGASADPGDMTDEQIQAFITGGNLRPWRNAMLAVA